jgi:hypothetical protein
MIDENKYYGEILINKSGKKYYLKHCKPEHFMIKYQGFGISQSVLDTLVKQNVEFVYIIYEGKSVCEYLCLTEQFLQSKKTHIFLDVDLQKFVSTKDMRLVVND